MLCYWNWDWNFTAISINYWSCGILKPFTLFVTSENFPSPNHCSQRMPWDACLFPVALQGTTIPGHQEKPFILPQTNSPIPKPLLSWGGNMQKLYIVDHKLTFSHALKPALGLKSTQTQISVNNGFNVNLNLFYIFKSEYLTSLVCPSFMLFFGPFCSHPACFCVPQIKEKSCRLRLVDYNFLENYPFK